VQEADAPYYVLGTDPGFKGACATVKVEGDKISVVDVFDMPTKIYPSETKNSKGRRGYDLAKLLPFLRKRCVIGRMYLESNLIMDSNSLYSTASTAFGAGLLLGMGYAVGGDVKFVNPRHWQAVLGKDPVLAQEKIRLKGLGKKPDTKQLAELFVKSQYKECIKLIYGPRGGLLDGRADAICIATFGAREVIRERKETLCKSKLS
jgi:hypothetical protein